MHYLDKLDEQYINFNNIFTKILIIKFKFSVLDKS